MSVSPTQQDPTDALFQLPLGEFTTARNALAAQLKKAGQSEEAHRVKAITKPSISAWAVNQVYWRHRKAFDRLIASGEQFRRAQASQLAGKSADVRRPFDDRREAVSELTRLATGALSEAGHQPTPDMTRRIASTLEALSIHGANGPAAGRLIDDVDPPGFETLAGLMPATGAPPDGRGSRTVLPFQQAARQTAAPRPNARESDEDRARREKAQRAEAKAAVQAADRSLREARAAAERAESAMKKAAARVKAAEQERLDAERRLEQATTESTEARQAARRVAGEAEDAAQAVADAERALEKARQAL